MVNFKEDLKHPIVKRWWQKPSRLFLLGIGLVILAALIWSAVVFLDIYFKLKNGQYDPRLFGNLSAAPYSMDQVRDPSDPNYGPKDAPIQVVEFGDFMCPNCLKSYQVLQEVRKKYPDKIHLSWRNLPVVSDYSHLIALAGECANAQGKFWPFHDRMFMMQEKITATNISDLAISSGLNEALFKKCYDSQILMYKVKDDMVLAQELGLSGTPTFFINGYKVPGHLPIEIWDKLVTQLISDQKAADSTK